MPAATGSRSLEFSRAVVFEGKHPGALMSEEFDIQYARLRDWYLAHLRKGAMEEEAKLQMTPAALIAADHDVVVRLAAGRTTLLKIEAARDHSIRIVSLRCAGLWLAACCCFFVWLLIDSGSNSGQAVRYFSLLTVDVWMENPAGSAKLPISPVFLLLPAIFYGVPLFYLTWFLLYVQRRHSKGR